MAVTPELNKVLVGTGAGSDRRVAHNRIKLLPPGGSKIKVKTQVIQTAIYETKNQSTMS